MSDRPDYRDVEVAEKALSSHWREPIKDGFIEAARLAREAETARHAPSVDPDLVKAREYAALAMEAARSTHSATRARNGDIDHWIIIKAVLLAIKGEREAGQ